MRLPVLTSVSADYCKNGATTSPLTTHQSPVIRLRCNSEDSNSKLPQGLKDQRSHHKGYGSLFDDTFLNPLAFSNPASPEDIIKGSSGPATLPQEGFTSPKPYCDSTGLESKESRENNRMSEEDDLAKCEPVLSIRLSQGHEENEEILCAEVSSMKDPPPSPPRSNSDFIESDHSTKLSDDSVLVGEEFDSPRHHSRLNGGGSGDNKHQESNCESGSMTLGRISASSGVGADHSGPATSSSIYSDSGSFEGDNVLTNFTNSNSAKDCRIVGASNGANNKMMSSTGGETSSPAHDCLTEKSRNGLIREHGFEDAGAADPVRHTRLGRGLHCQPPSTLMLSVDAPTFHPSSTCGATGALINGDMHLSTSATTNDGYVGIPGSDATDGGTGAFHPLSEGENGPHVMFRHDGELCAMPSETLQQHLGSRNPNFYTLTVPPSKGGHGGPLTGPDLMQQHPGKAESSLTNGHILNGPTCSETISRTSRGANSAHGVTTYGQQQHQVAFAAPGNPVAVNHSLQGLDGGFRQPGQQQQQHQNFVSLVGGQTGGTSVGASGGGSQFSASPGHSRGSSPLNFPGGNGNNNPSCPRRPSNVVNSGYSSASGQGTTGGQNAIYVHVNPGETLSVRVGNEIQHIPGPATVRMVSQNPGLPAPLPINVPPGHTVQQIVDEHGVLRHLILSPQTPPSAPGFVQNYPASSLANGPFAVPHVGPSTSNGSGSFGGYSPSPPVGHRAHIRTPGTPPLIYPGGNVHGIHTTLPHVCQYIVEEQPNNFAYDDRTEGVRKRLMQKLKERKGYGNKPADYNVMVEVLGSKKFGEKPTGHEPSNDDVHSATEDEETNKLMELLSRIQPPQVCDIGPNEARVQWQAVDCTEASSGPFPEIELSDFAYEVYVAEGRQDGRYRQMYRGSSTQHKLEDLKPATEYFVKLRALLEYYGISGEDTDPVGFCTKSDKPEKPLAPRLQGRTKNTITLRWNAAAANGSPIHAYHLECDQGRGNNSWVEVFSAQGNQKQFKMQKLNPATTYRFRLSAENELGKSEYSDVLLVSTCGQAPVAPEFPTLLHATPSEICLGWRKRPEDESFILQYEDSESGYGFVNVYTGKEQKYHCTNLNRNSTFKFRLAVVNEDGNSPWSECVEFATLPDKPGAPGKPYQKGKFHANSIRVAWDPPKDTGGGDIQRYIVECDTPASGDGQWVMVYSGLDREFTHSGLQPGQIYNYRAACTSVGGLSGYSDTLSCTTLPVAPEACEPPKLHSKPKSVSVHIKWKEPCNNGGSTVTGYEVQVIHPDTTSQIISAGLKTDCIIGNLLPGRPYSLAIRAHNKAGAGRWSETLSCKTAASVPEPPCMLTSIPKTARSIQVSWSSPESDNGSPITEYRVFVAMRRVIPTLQVPEGEECEKVAVESEVGVLEAGPSEDEVVAVRGDLESASLSSEGGRSAYASLAGSSERSRRTTPSSSAQSSPVHSLHSQSSVDVEFSTFLHAHTASGNSCEVKNLNPATEYAFKVQAISSAGSSKLSPMVTCHTPPAPPSVVLNVQTEVLSTSEISVIWGKAENNGSAITAYRLEYSPCADGEPNFVEIPGSSTHCILDDLLPETCYRIRIQAVNDVGPSSFSSPVKATTFGLPPPPPLLECVGLSHNTLKLKWTDEKVTQERLSYALEMENKSGSFSPVYEGTSHLHKANRLSECSSYKFRIRSISETGGTGPWSLPYTFSTTRAPPASVKSAPRIVDVSETCCRLDWSNVKVAPPSPGDKILYRLQLQNARLPGDDFKTVYAGTDSTFLLNALMPNVTYKARVCLVRQSSGGLDEVCGAFSPVLAFSTQAPPVQNRTVDGLSSQPSKEETESGGVGGEWTDQQRALFILAVATVAILLVAFLIQWYIANR